MSEKVNLDKRFTSKRNYDIKALWERHHEITRQVVLGRTNVAIAEAIGCTPQTVSNVRTSPLAKAKIDSMSEQRDSDTISIAARIEQFAPVALELLEQIVTGSVPEASIALRAKIASSHLSRAGYGEVHKAHILSQHLSREDIERIKTRAVNAAQSAGIIEAAYERVD